MEQINVFYHREGLREVEHLEVSPDTTFAALKALLIKKHGLGGDMVLFVEDIDDPVDEAKALRVHKSRAGVKVHVHRCRQVDVAVSFNGMATRHRFGPGTTVARVKKWAAEGFGMTPEDASEHVLQLAGTHDRPPPGTHLGALANCPACQVAFDLVPDQRVNGAS